MGTLTLYFPLKISIHFYYSKDTNKKIDKSQAKKYIYIHYIYLTMDPYPEK